MENIFYSSKDEIRNRMFRNAKDFWNVANVSNFDPLVKLLIEALSNEIFNISNDIKNLENRMLDKIAGILSADKLVSAVPAHTILHAMPNEGIEIINSTTQFVFSKRIRDNPEEKNDTVTDLYFGPIHSAKIFKLSVSHIATARKLFKFDTHHNRSILSQAISHSSIDTNVIYIGLTVPNQLDNYNGLTFYFDWRDYAVESQSYDLLSLLKWSIDGAPLPISNGFPSQQRDGKQSPFNNDLMDALADDVFGYYASRFFTLADGSALQQRMLHPVVPLDLKQTFPEISEYSELPQLWLKVTFPIAITAGMLEELFISVNAFPVVNKQLHNYKHRLSVMSDIVPLKLDEDNQFLAVNSLEDSFGNQYTEIPIGYDQERSSGLFSIRYGGTERFDQRNAQDILDYLLELLRDEKAAFAAYGSDFLTTNLLDLEKSIAKIKLKINADLTDKKELTNYVVVKPIKDAQILYLQYWTTRAETGNQIGFQSSLSVINHQGIIPESIFLLSTSFGGRSRLKRSDRIQAYKYGLTTGDRIVTKADVLNFCLYELGHLITKAEITRGLITEPGPKGGFLTTTDIVVTKSGANLLSAEEWISILELTKSKLQLRSTLNVHYRILSQE